MVKTQNDMNISSHLIPKIIPFLKSFFLGLPIPLFWTSSDVSSAGGE